jgi:hypothetical protein
MQNTQIVAGIFHGGPSFSKAFAEFQWTLRQNPLFWKSAVLYCDPEAWPHVRRYETAVREIIVDDALPEVVREHRVWNCKGWWAAKALERFPRILYCDFDIYVVRQPDEALEQFLDCGPKFLYMSGYKGAGKQVGCGVVLYDRDTPDFDKFLDLLYHKWRHDERAWTEALSMTGEKLLTSSLNLNPHIVDYSRLLDPPEPRPVPYIIHGISGIDDGRYRMRRIGYGNRPFSMSLPERVGHWKNTAFRLLVAGGLIHTVVDSASSAIDSAG